MGKKVNSGESQTRSIEKKQFVKLKALDAGAC